MAYGLQSTLNEENDAVIETLWLDETPWPGPDMPVYEARTQVNAQVASSMRRAGRTLKVGEVGWFPIKLHMGPDGYYLNVAYGKLLSSSTQADPWVLSLKVEVYDE